MFHFEMLPEQMITLLRMCTNYNQKVDISKIFDTIVFHP